MLLIKVKNKFATLNLVPGQRVYGEKIVKKGGKEYRIWDPFRSKLAAALTKGMKIDFKPDWLVLYLGVATGTTASHLSDLLPNGMIFGVDVAPRVLREFVLLAETRKNLVPILADANKPSLYEPFVPEVDFLYQDVAQPNQDEILIKNAKRYLKKNGLAFVAIKARSIDVTKKPEQVFKEFKEKIKKYFEILQEKRLDPFDKDHLALLLKKK